MGVMDVMMFVLLVVIISTAGWVSYVPFAWVTRRTLSVSVTQMQGSHSKVKTKFHDFSMISGYFSKK